MLAKKWLAIKESWPKNPIDRCRFENQLLEIHPGMGCDRYDLKSCGQRHDLKKNRNIFCALRCVVVAYLPY